MQINTFLTQDVLFGACDAAVLNNTTPLEGSETPFEVTETTDCQTLNYFAYALGTLQKRHTMQIFNWGVSVTGRVPGRIWKNTEPIIVRNSMVFAAYSGPQLRVTELCADRLQEVLRISEQFSASYNQILVQGAASYCLTVLKRLDESNPLFKDLLAKIRRFTSQAESICEQYEKLYATSFSLLNLQALEDQFDMIQADSAKLKLFPLLRDIPTKELVLR